MTKTTDMISSEVKYLIKTVNHLLASTGAESYVDIDMDFKHEVKKTTIAIDLNYKLFHPDKEPTLIFASSIKVDPEFFYMNQTLVLDELNDAFYLEILLHTDFGNKKNIFAGSGPRLN